MRLRIIHQALFGYSGGHHLISSSCVLSAQDLKVLEPLSDLSGAGMPPTFDGYLTGYYMKQMDCIALCKTWFAKEMPRPGCVWTHVFFIPADLTCGETERLLKEKDFLRPNIMENGWEQAYSAAIELDEVSAGQLYGNVEEASLAHGLLSALAESDYSIVVSAGGCAAFNDALLTLLKAFSPCFFKDIPFCTGAFSNRIIGRTLFQIQVVPNEISKSAWKMSSANICFFNENEILRNEARYSSAEISEAIVLFESSEMCKLSRRGLASLLYTMDAISIGDLSGLKEELTDILKIFGEGCGRLVQSIMGRYFSTVFEDPVQVDNVKLGALCALDFSVPNWDSGISQMSLDRTAHKFFLQGQDAVVETMNILFTESLNGLGERMLQALANALDAETFYYYIAHSGDKVGALVSLNRELALNPGLWTQSYGVQCDALNALSHLYRETEGTEDDFYTRLLQIIYQNSRESLADRIYQGFSTLAIKAYFMWASQEDNTSNCAWCRICRHDPVQSVLTLLNVSKISVFVDVIGTLDPYAANLRTLDPDVWVGLYESFCKDAPQAIQEAYAKFLTPIILLSEARFSEDLAGFAFTRVHKILAESRMDDLSWGKLSDILPELIIFNMWDRCKRLRKAVKNKNYSVNFTA